jgi:medium-chain acyl-[acyl-carrier-protein] hydrolase
MRIGEPPIDAADALADAATQGLLPFLDRPFALFGHSLGAILGFEVALRLEREHGLTPRRLFVSGRGAPHIAVPRTSAHELPDVDFVAHLRTLNGTPEVLLNNAELMELMLPAIRADFKASETYAFTPGSRLSCPVSAIGGLADGHVPAEAVSLWSELTTGPFESRLFTGDHFFLHNAEASVIDHVRTQLAGELYTMRA